MNLGVDDTLQATLLDAGVWAGIEGSAQREGSYVLGVDLGGAASMSAACAYWPASGALEAVGCFGAVPDLRERGLRDGVGRLYADMARRGELVLAGGRVPDVSTLLSEVLERWGSAVGDRLRPLARGGAARRARAVRVPALRADRARAGIQGRRRRRARLPAGVPTWPGDAGPVVADALRDERGAGGQRHRGELEAREE